MNFNDYNELNSQQFVDQSEIYPDNNTHYTKIKIDNTPYRWDGNSWFRDYSARVGEYDNCPEVRQPHTLSGW